MEQSAGVQVIKQGRRLKQGLKRARPTSRSVAICTQSTLRSYSNSYNKVDSNGISDKAAENLAAV